MESVRIRVAVRPPLARRPRGTLLLEVGIVIVLAAIFLSLLLPQFVRARGVARRMQCLNNLKNVALALQNYSEQHECFPPGYVARDVSPVDSADAETGPGWAWGTLILPQCEQGALYQSFDFRLDVTGSGAVVAAYVCPDADLTPFAVAGDAGLVTLPPSSFVGVAGRGSLTLEPGNPPLPGMFYRNSRVRQDDVYDGISNTLLLGERRQLVTQPDGVEIDASATWIGAVAGAARDAGYPGEERFEAAGAMVLGVVGQFRPIPVKGTPQGGPPGIGFSSTHTGGAHFARVDGSCLLISEQIDAELFMRLGQRADGEPASWP